MAGKRPSGHSLGYSQISAFRLRRHHLLERGGAAALTTICGDVCGIQAQVMSAAEMAVWARARGVTRSQIHAALWEERVLVKTSLMRQTLHLIPAADFSLYIAALKRSRVQAVLRVMARFGITREEAFAINEIVAEALRGGSLTQPELRQAIRPRVSKRVCAWMDRVSSVLRIALAEGLICYGRARRQEVAYARADRWLPKQKDFEEEKAKQILIRRFLRAYGPATLADFCKWSGIPVREAKPVWESLKQEFISVSADGQARSLLREDEKTFTKSELGEPVVRLLPSFDPFLLAHAKKDHLVDAARYKRVYRNQGWISPVVLVDGRVAGVWSPTRRAKRMVLEVELFEKTTRASRAALEKEAASLGAFLGVPCQVRIKQ